MAHIDVQPDRVDIALSELLARGVLTADQSAEVRSALARADSTKSRPNRWWAEVAGYLGGVLMAGGAALLLATAWDDLTDPIRAALLAGIGVVLVGAGLVIGRMPRDLRRLRAGAAPARRRVVGVLFALASAAAAGAAAVVVDGHEGVAAGTLGLLVASGGYTVLRTAPGLLASALASLILVVSTVEEFGAAPVPAGIVYVLLGAGWVALAAVGLAVPRAVGLGTGAVLAIVGAQQPLTDPGWQGLAYALTLGVALACFALYRWRPDAVLLVGGVVGVAIVAPEMVWDWTDGAAGGSAILLVAGGALISASAFGLGLWRRSR